MEKLYIIIPAYNESENIEQVINEWYPIIEKYNGDGMSRLVIIDDGSHDNTYSLMQKLSANKPLFTPITKENSGHGATVLYGYNYAVEKNADYVFQTDSDGQTVPNEFHQFWQNRNNYDMIIGHRSKREDGFSRVFVTKILKFVVSLLFKENITDANTPFRLMSANTLKNVISYIPNDYNLSNVVISVLYKKLNLKVKYIPITFRQRQGGVNSINLKRIFGIGKQAVKDFKAINNNLKNINS